MADVAIQFLFAMSATPSPQLRRIACSGESNGGAALAAAPRNSQAYSFNFTSPEPDQLPSSLVDRMLEMPGGGYSIGACVSQRGNNGMTTYRVLLVLYR